MARPSKIDRLPAELKELIGELRTKGATIDEIMAKLKELQPDIDISRTGLGEHVRLKIDSVLASVGRTRAIAEAIAPKIQDKSYTDVARLNAELLHGAIFNLVSAGEAGEEARIDPKEALALSRSLQAINSSMKSIADLEAQIRREMADKAATIAEKAISASGAPDRAALVQKVRQEIFGLV